MYAPYHYAFHDPSAVGPGAPPPPPPQQSYLGQPHYPHPHPGDMTDPNAIHPHHPHHHSPPAAPRLPALQVTQPPQSKLRSRREIASDSPSRGAAPPLITANMTPEEEAAAREEARKARKREMGRERQRRKRLRDKAKREAEKVRERMEAAGHMSEPGALHPSALQMPFGARPNAGRASLSSLSVGSYDSVHSSASSSYATLPPMGTPISPSNSFGAYSDASSPSHSFSPALSATNSLNGFTSDSSWNEHTAVFGNLSLTGDNDATVRVKPPRSSGANLSGITGSRRQSDTEYPFGTVRRRKSDLDDDQQVGLGVMDWQRTGGSKPRRPVSVPDGIVLESIHPPSRSPSPPPPLATDMSRPDYRSPYGAPSPEGLYFSNAVVQGLHETQWGGLLHTKLGIQQDDLNRMSPELAGVYDRYRVENNNISSYFLDPDTRAHVMSQQSPPATSPRTGAFGNTGAPRREGDRPTSSASSSSVAAPSGTMHLGQAHPPATPQSKPGQSSTATSPVNPALQTPATHGQPMFPPMGEYPQPQWSTAPQLSRSYDPEWQQRGGYAHTLSSPMTSNPKDNAFAIPPPPGHGPPAHPQIAVQTNFVNTAEFQTPGSSGPRSGAPFTPATPVPQRGHNMSGPANGVPLFYNPQFHQPPPPPHPIHTPVQDSPSQPLPPSSKEGGDMFLQQQQQQVQSQQQQPSQGQGQQQ